MRLRLFAYSRQGILTARKIQALFPADDCLLLVPDRLQETDMISIPKPSAPCYAEAFESSDCLVFVSSCGIAVRQIAPCVRDKLKDPAVLCVDELGKFVISLLSGHVGGANALAERVAMQIGAITVVTTATDINGRFSVDAWCSRNGFLFDDRHTAKDISAAILEGEVPVSSEYPISGALPLGLCYGESGELGIHIGCTFQTPFVRTLHIIPKLLHIGIGCRRGTSEAAIRQAVEKVFFDNCLDLRAAVGAFSIDLKADEEGLLSYCHQNHLPVHFYAADQLKRVEGDFTSSDFVSGVTGVDNVCERSAMIGAERLLVKKTIVSGVTVAVAAERLVINFG